MFASAIVLLLLVQFVNHNSKALDRMPQTSADSSRALAVLQEGQFAGSIKRFVEKLRDFVQQYNADRSINIKKIKALKKAWRDVEQTEPWLRTLPKE
jgi:hypothetical protein